MNDGFRRALFTSLTMQTFAAFGMADGYVAESAALSLTTWMYTLAFGGFSGITSTIWKMHQAIEKKIAIVNVRLYISAHVLVSELAAVLTILLCKWREIAFTEAMVCVIVAAWGGTMLMNKLLARFNSTFTDTR